MELRYKNKDYKISKSTRKGKKYKVLVNGEYVHFGAKGYRMYPNTKRGDSYCARSSGIKGVNDMKSANFWSRLKWKCQGKRSVM